MLPECPDGKYVLVNHTAEFRHIMGYSVRNNRFVVVDILNSCERMLADGVGYVPYRAVDCVVDENHMLPYYPIEEIQDWRAGNGKSVPDGIHDSVCDGSKQEIKYPIQDYEDNNSFACRRSAETGVFSVECSKQVDVFQDDKHLVAELCEDGECSCLQLVYHFKQNSANFFGYL